MLKNSTHALQPDVIISEQSTDAKVWIVPSSMDSTGLPAHPVFYSPVQLFADQHTSTDETLNRHKSENSIVQSDNCHIAMQPDELNKEVKMEYIETTSFTSDAREHSHSTEIQRIFEKSTSNRFISNVPALAFNPGDGHQKNMCNLCGKCFRSRQQLNQHTLVHTDVRKYKCTYCSRAFKQPSHLHQHHRIHTGEKPYRCPMPGCGRAFPQLSNLNHHLRNHDKPAPPSENTCIFCDRVYASDAVLRNHMSKIHCWKADDRLEGDVMSSLTHTRTDTRTTDPTPFFQPGSSLPLTLELQQSFVSTTPISCTFPSTPLSHPLTSFSQLPSLQKFLPKSKLPAGSDHSNEQTDAVQTREHLNRQTNHAYSKVVKHRSSKQSSDTSTSSSMSNSLPEASYGRYPDVRVQSPCNLSQTYSRNYDPVNTTASNKMTTKAANGLVMDARLPSNKSKSSGSTRAIYSTIPLAKIKQTMNHYKSLQHRMISKRDGSTDAKKGSEMFGDRPKVATTEISMDKDINESFSLSKYSQSYASTRRFSNEPIVCTDPLETFELDPSNNSEHPMYEETDSDNGIQALRQTELGHIDNKMELQSASNYALIEHSCNVQANCQSPDALYKSLNSVNGRLTSANYSVFDKRNCTDVETKKSASSCKINILSSDHEHLPDANRNRNQTGQCSTLSSTVHEAKDISLEHDNDEIREESASGDTDDDIKYHYTLCNSVANDDTCIQYNQKTKDSTMTRAKDNSGDLQKGYRLTDNSINVAEIDVAKEWLGAAEGMQSCEQKHLVSPTKSRKRKSFQPHRVVYDRKREFDYQY